MRSNVEQGAPAGAPGWTYDLFRKLFGRSLRVFFRQIEVEGAEHVPESGGGILIAWHPNAVVDGMLLAAECPRPVTFGARHGLFAVPLLGWIFRQTGTVPIYRTVDMQGTDEEIRRAANLRSLDALARAVAEGRLVCLFPEGQSHDAPHPAPMKTGTARLLERARELGGDEEDPFVIPVALDYGAKDRGRSTVLLRFHAPLVLPGELSRRQPGESEQAFYARMRAITDVFERAIHDVVLATDDWDSHRLMHRTRKLIRAELARRRATDPGPATLGEKRAGFARVWTAYRATVARNPDGVEALLERLAEYDRALREIQLEDHDLDRDRAAAAEPFLPPVARAGLSLALLTPLALFGYATNGLTALFLAVLARVAGRQAKDRATIKVLGGMLLLPLTWIAVGILAGVAVSRWVTPPPGAAVTAGIGIAAALSSIAGMSAGFAFNRIVSETLRRVRVRARRLRHRGLIERLLGERSALFDDMLAASEGIRLPGRVTADGVVRPE